jgi:dihydroorotate dehydrogenase electron transfer subunit
MRHGFARVLSQRRVSTDYREIRFTWPFDETPFPGQFFTLRLGPSPVPLLRRPFAFASYDPVERVASTIYEKRGQATSLLSSMQKGDSLDILAPLGNAFVEPGDQTRPVLLAGGIGIGPMAYFASSIAAAGPLLVIGARSVNLLPKIELPTGVSAVYATDDGSRGHPGTVVDVLADSEKSGGLRLSRDETPLFACGPWGMLKAAHEFASERNLRLWVSVEQTMGCAVGACMGCVVRVRSSRKYARVCTEGPIFRSEELVWT